MNDTDSSPKSVPAALSNAAAAPAQQAELAVGRLLEQIDRNVRPAEALLALGRHFVATGVFDLAHRCFAEAHRRAPDEPAIRRSLGLSLCRRGDIAEGLRHYEARWQLDELKPVFRPFPQPPWRGERLAGKRILLWAEQGVGDQLMQARCLGPILAAGARVTLEGDPRLFPLLSRSFPGVEWKPQFTEPSPELMRGAFDFQSSLLSAWRWTMPATLAGWRPEPYLVPDPTLVASYRNTWHRRGWTLNVGLSWRSRAKKVGEQKSIEPALLRPLIADQRLTFHSLQYGADRDEVRELSNAVGRPVLLDTESDALNNLDRLAAQIKALDLVVSIDNTTIHLAGAMAVPCWVMLAAASDWRWGERGETTPLYRNMRLFRQAQFGSWADVIARLRFALVEWIGERHHGAALPTSGG